MNSNNSYLKNSSGKQYKSVLVLLLFVVIAFISILLFGNSWRNDNYHVYNRSNYINSNWVVTDEAGNVVNADADLPYTAPAEGASITFSKHFVYAETHTDAILFNPLRQSIEVGIDEKQIFSVNRSWISRILRITGTTIVKTNSDRDIDLKITIYNTGQKEYVLEEVKAGTMIDIIITMLSAEIMTVINISALFLCLVVLIGAECFFLIKKHYDIRLINLIAFALIAVLWAFCDSPLVYLTPLNPEIAELASYILFFAFPIPAMYYSANTCHRKHKELDRAIAINYAVIIIRLLLAVLGLVKLNNSLFISHMAIVITIIAGCTTAWEEMRTEGNSDWTAGLFRGYVVLFICTISALITYWFGGGPLYRAVMLTGISIFFGILIIIAIFSNASDMQNSAVRAERIRILEDELNTDELTGLENRRAFEKYLMEIEGNPEKHPDACMIMLDLNGLKVTNDTYGHNAGDELIANAAKCITETLGADGGRCFRIGGDEFTVIMDVVESGLVPYMSRMQQWMNKYNETAVCKLSIAHGESSYRTVSGHFRTISDWKQDADVNMYSNKRGSKNYESFDLVEEYKEIIRCIINTIETKDELTVEHSARVKQIAIMAAEKLGLPETYIRQVEIASLMHDIGKISIPDEILLKPKGLNNEEFEIMKQHSIQGAKILSHANSLQITADIVLHHHERYDGTGYPDGLKGDAIPIGARIIFIADSIDAMMTRRAYRQAYSIDRCREEIEKNIGTMYDPEVGKVILDNWREVVDILLSHPNDLI
ncbi:MAG: diguanylate cyclase [Eubacteriales bacterium]|nr:diguanylate cyclase [Eubacteriales bacterium]